MLAVTPLRIYNDSNRPKHIRKRPTKVNDELVQLRQRITMYKRERAKLRKLAENRMRLTSKICCVIMQSNVCKRLLTHRTKLMKIKTLVRTMSWIR